MCGIEDVDTDAVIREKIRTTLHKLCVDLPAELRLALDVALAIDARTRLPLLADRFDWLAGELRCQPRTARRRVDHAFALITQAALSSTGVDDSPADPERGWYVRRLKALLRLDSRAPELYEERTIVATGNNLAEIRPRFSLPRPDPGRYAEPADPTRVRLIAEVLHGARMVELQRLGDSHFRFVLALPRALDAGDEHEYTTLVRVPENQPMRPHYAYVPLVACESFQLRVRFDPARPPAAVWRIDRAPTRLLDDPTPTGERLHLDDGGELHLEVTDLEQGYGYGVAWTPTTVDIG